MLAENVQTVLQVECIRVVCDTCRGMLAQKQEAERRRREHETRRERRRHKASVLRRKIEHTIPPLYREATLRTLNPRTVNRILRDKPFWQGLFLYGPVGVGKTWAAMALARYYVACGKTVRRYTYREMLLMIRGAFARNTSELEAMRPLLSADVLIIDDLAACKTTEFAMDVVLHVIDHRIEQCRPTVITSNLSMDEIHRDFGDRLKSRLKTFRRLHVGGRDKRETAKNSG